MTRFPVNDVLDELLHALHSSPCVLLNAPTGAGKSTWLPLQLLQHADISGRILMLEPRRLATRNVAVRLAQQLGENIGETIGYRMRMETKVSQRTRLEVVTEGILTRLLQANPLLEGVGLVILDEFHERSLQADLALALLLDVQQGLREDLKLLIMSATLDNARLETVLPNAAVIVSQGHSYPVLREFHSLVLHERFEDAVAGKVLQLLYQQSGSLLLFLPGVAEIMRVMERLAEKALSNTDLCPLYGGLPLDEQQKAILSSPVGRRKVVLATNIAETSLTIEGIRLVIDSGLEREARFDPRSGITRLVTQRVSKASMVQRAGRAGRLEPGICWHLLSKEQAERCVEYSEPEILHSDLCAMWLELLQWGCTDMTQLYWLDPPPVTSLSVAKALLDQLGALSAPGQLSSTGRRMAELGCHPRFAAMLLAGQVQGKDALATAALLTAILEEPPRQGHIDMGFWLMQPQPYWQRRAQQLVRRIGGAVGVVDPALAPCLLAHGFTDRIACRRGQEGRYRLANGLGVQMDPDDPLSSATWLVVAQLLQGANNSDIQIKLAIAVDPDEFDRCLSHRLQEQTVVEWDEQRGSLQAWQRRQIGCLILKAQPLKKPSEIQLQQALLAWIRDHGLEQLGWDHQSCQLRLRLHCARKWLPDADWPAVDDESLLNTLEQWLLPFLHGVTDLRGLRKINLNSALESRLDWSLKHRLDSALPTHYIVPTGSRLSIRYDSELPPTLAVRLQEVLGERESPKIADGRVPLVLELLSPAHRLLQITCDLAAFWQGAYREVQKEMKGRYPKHLWPDDPANTVPTRRTRHPPIR